MSITAILSSYIIYIPMIQRHFDWDKNHATDKERKLAKIQNQKSGISLLAAEANS